MNDHAGEDVAYRRSVLAQPHVAPADDELRLSRRDRIILAATRSRLEGTREDFREALRAMTDAVMANIPNGRIYVFDRAPLVFGSLVSGVGIVEAEDHVAIERLDARGRHRLARLRR